uniref:Uncharacterized protein n=1 Tax=Tolypothrix bouteillei VB521301 TaxID=1479485 RepID=A0A0C1RD43_9CYAN
MSKSEREKNEIKKEASKLLATGASQSDVARKLGISRQLLSYWCKSQEFQQEVVEAKQLLQKRMPKEEPPALKPVPTAPEIHPKISDRQRMREQELLLLNDLQSCLLDQLKEEGSIKSVALLLKLSERRCKLLGLDQKPFEIAEAYQILAEEGVLPASQVNYISERISDFQEDLRQSYENSLASLPE